MKPIDKIIGANLVRIRKARALSQIELGERIGVSFQQIQKYEKGATRISVQRLQQLAEALEVPLTVLLQEEEPFRVASPMVQYGEIHQAGGDLDLQAREEAQLVKLFRLVTNPKIREGLLKQLRGVVELEQAKEGRKK